MLGIIGAGKLGTAIALRLAKSRDFKGSVIVADRNGGKLSALKAAGAEVTGDNCLAAQKSDVILVCVKPKDIDALFQQIGGACRGKLVISAAAGVSLHYLEKMLPGARAIRCMPNLAVSIGMSETAVSVSKSVTASDKKTAEGIFRLLGNHHYIAEEKMAAWTGFCASYPAYACLLIDSVARAAQSEGIGRADAIRLVEKVTLSTAHLLLETGEDPLALANRVASPGGTTEAGLKAAEKAGLQGSFTAVLDAAIKRAKELEK